MFTIIAWLDSCSRLGVVDARGAGSEKAVRVLASLLGDLYRQVCEALDAMLEDISFDARRGVLPPQQPAACFISFPNDVPIGSPT